MEKSNSSLSKSKEYLIQEKNKYNERENKIREIFIDDKYIKWLENIINKYFEINDWKFIKDNKKILKEDIDNINILSLLFAGIARYASKNYIYPVIDYNNSEYYKFKYNNNGYYIGLNTNNGSYCYCKKVNEIDNTFIDFNDIVNNKDQDNTIYINNTLNQLYENLINYYKSGIPLQALSDTLESGLWEIKTLENKKKILRK